MDVEDHLGHIRQSTVTLSYFDYEIPILYLSDGTAYIPVVELCKMLGLRASSHIPRWRRLILWSNARKLPYQTSTRGRQIVWCLHAGALAFWFIRFDWTLVLPERREQLQQAMDRGMDAVAQTHQIMLARYKSIRQLLFEFLTAYSNIETTLPQLQAVLHIYINDSDACFAFNILICQERTLINDAIMHARSMLQDQATIPVVDAVRVNIHGEVVEELALPLFPVVPEEDVRRFFTYLEKIALCHQHMMDFLGTYGIHWNREQKKWYLE